MKIQSPVLALIMSLLLFGCDAQEAIEVSDARIRWLPGSGPMAGYFEMTNNMDRSIKLKGATSTAFGNISIHQTSEVNGQMQMKARDHLGLEVGQAVIFRPGDLHLMLKQPQQDINVGDTVTIELKFEDLPSVAVDFLVRAPGDV